MIPVDLVLAICTFNNCEWLARTLDAIERQVPTRHRWSVLVVDNNSTDATAETVGRYVRAARIPGLALVKEPLQGLSHARRRAVLESSAPLIAFVDDDCLLEHDWVEQAVAFMNHHSRAGAVGGRVRLEWERPPDEWLLRHAESFAEQHHGERPVRLPESGFTYLVGAGLLIRREALLASGWMERGRLVDRRGRKLGGGGDTELVLRIRNAGYELWYHPALSLSHWIPARRMSLRHLCGLNRGFGRSYPVFEVLVRGVVPSPQDRLRSLARNLKDVGRLLTDVAGPRRKGPRSRRDAAIELCWAVGRVEGELALLVSSRSP